LPQFRGLIACAVLASACQNAPSENRLLAELAPGIRIGQPIPLNIPAFGPVSAPPCGDDSGNYSYRSDAKDSGAVISTLVLYTSGCRPAEEVSAPVTGVLLIASVGHSGELWRRLEPLAFQVYGQAPDSGCLSDGPSRRRQVWFWRSRIGTTTFIFPSDSAREVNYRQPATVSITRGAFLPMPEQRRGC
jgi:hypothetical protein